MFFRGSLAEPIHFFNTLIPDSSNGLIGLAIVPLPPESHLSGLHEMVRSYSTSLPATEEFGLRLLSHAIKNYIFLPDLELFLAQGGLQSTTFSLGCSTFSSGLVWARPPGRRQAFFKIAGVNKPEPLDSGASCRS